MNANFIKINIPGRDHFQFLSSRTNILGVGGLGISNLGWSAWGLKKAQSCGLLSSAITNSVDPEHQLNNFISNINNNIDISALYPINITENSQNPRQEIIDFYKNSDYFTITDQNNTVYRLKPVLVENSLGQIFFHWELGTEHAFTQPNKKFFLHFSGNLIAQNGQLKTGQNLIKTLDADTIQIIPDYAPKGLNGLLNPELSIFNTSVYGSIAPHITAYNYLVAQYKDFDLNIYAHSYGNFGAAAFIDQLYAENKNADKKIVVIGSATAASFNQTAVSLGGSAANNIFTRILTSGYQCDVFKSFSHKNVRAIIVNNCNDDVIKWDTQIQHHPKFPEINPNANITVIAFGGPESHREAVDYFDPINNFGQHNIYQPGNPVKKIRNSQHKKNKDNVVKLNIPIESNQIIQDDNDIQINNKNSVKTVTLVEKVRSYYKPDSQQPEQLNQKVKSLIDTDDNKQPFYALRLKYNLNFNYINIYTYWAGCKNLSGENNILACILAALLFIPWIISLIFNLIRDLTVFIIKIIYYAYLYSLLLAFSLEYLILSVVEALLWALNEISLSISEKKEELDKKTQRHEYKSKWANLNLLLLLPWLALVALYFALKIIGLILQLVFLVCIYLPKIIIEFIFHPLDTLNYYYKLLSQCSEKNNIYLKIILFIPRMILAGLKILLTIMFCPIKTVNEILKLENKYLKIFLIIIIIAIFIAAWVSLFIFATPVLPILFPHLIHLISNSILHQLFGWVSLKLAEFLILPILKFLSIHSSTAAVAATATIELPTAAVATTVVLGNKTREFFKSSEQSKNNKNLNNAQYKQLEQLSDSNNDAPNNKIINFNQLIESVLSI